jgi:ADP-dependent NAD(P)H-hydrate dehydratase / NAD(P)H-hydrate epimerase
MIKRLLPNTTTWPVWRRAGIRALESRLQAESSAPLMDMAGLATARLAMAVAPHAHRIWIVAGPGNNGGDGLEAATHFHRWGRSVQVSLLGDPQQLPVDARRAFERATQAGVPIEQGLPNTQPELTKQDLCIDALLGIGATRAPEGGMLQAIQWLNASAATVLAVDIPTGLDADSGQPLGTTDLVVQADHTLTLLGAKPGLFMSHGRDACGTLWLAPLGLPADADSWYSSDAQLNPPAHPALRLHASHKGSHGDVAVVGGESHPQGSSMTGAAVLAAKGALLGGAGRVMLSLLGQDTPALVPDLMGRDLHDLDLPRLTVVAGCGGGQAIAEPLGRLLQHSAQLVLDADALNRVAADPWKQALLAQRTQRRQATVLTPHPLEAARLLGCTTEQVQADRLAAADQLAQRFDCCVVLKGSGTVIAAPGHALRINTTGNGLLATGGTGDVLAGLTGARLAANGNAWQAACDAVWTHGQLADVWPQGHALTASRLADRLR